MEKLDLQVITGDIRLRNKEQLKEAVQDQIGRFEGLIIPEQPSKEELGFMREKRAEINRMIKALNRERIDKKKMFMKPVIAFEKEVNEVIEVAQPIADMFGEAINDDRKRRENLKKIDIDALVAGKNVELSDFEIEVSPQWYNLSFSRQKAIEEIDEAFEVAFKQQKEYDDSIKAVKIAAETLGMDGSAWETMVRSGHSSNDVIQKMNVRYQEIQEEQQRQKELEEQQEKKRLEQEALAKEQAEQQAKNQEDQPIVEPIPVQAEPSFIEPETPVEPAREPEPVIETDIVTNVIRVTGTVESLNKMADFCRENNIKVVVVER